MYSSNKFKTEIQLITWVNSNVEKTLYLFFLKTLSKLKTKNYI